MRACRIDIKNFRGISKATILFPKHGVLIGDNNTGKTTTLEALNLVLDLIALTNTPLLMNMISSGENIEPNLPM